MTVHVLFYIRTLTFWEGHMIPCWSPVLGYFKRGQLEPVILW